MAKVLGSICIALLWSMNSAALAGEETIRLTDLDVVEPADNALSAGGGRSASDPTALMFGFGILLRPHGSSPGGVGSVTFKLNKWFTDFSASFSAVKDSECHGETTIVFQILADQTELMASMNIRDEKEFLFKQLNVSDVTTLTIHVQTDSSRTDCVIGVVDSPKVWR